MDTPLIRKACEHEGGRPPRVAPMLLTGIGFTSWLKVHACGGLVLGAGLGVIGCVLACMGADTHIATGDIRLEGMTAALVYLLLLPPVLALAATVAATISFAPLLGLLRMTHGIEVRIAIRDRLVT